MCVWVFVLGGADHNIYNVIDIKYMTFLKKQRRQRLHNNSPICDIDTFIAVGFNTVFQYHITNLYYATS